MGGDVKMNERVEWSVGLRQGFDRVVIRLLRQLRRTTWDTLTLMLTVLPSLSLHDRTVIAIRPVGACGDNGSSGIDSGEVLVVDTLVAVMVVVKLS